MTAGPAEIDLKVLKTAVNSVLDHIMEDLGIERVAIEPAENFYWECFAAALDGRTAPPSLDVGRLTDDMEFTTQSVAMMACR